MITMRNIIVISLLFPLGAALAKADTAYLKNGDIISGDIVSYADGICVLRSYGAVVSLKASEISALNTEKTYEVSFASGESVKGSLLRGQDGGTLLKSQLLGQVPVRADQITAMKPIFIAEPAEDKKNGTKSTSTASPGDEQKASRKGQNYGQEGKKEPPLDFLTGSAVLLKPGAFEVELGTGYTQARARTAPAGYFERSNTVARQWEFSVSMRAGLWKEAEGWVSLPYTYSTVKEVSGNEQTRSSSDSAVGDISFGLQQTLFEESAYFPSVTISLAVSTPTGSKRYRQNEDIWLNPLDNGSGNWAISPGLTFTRTIDPAILFWGVNYSYAFERTIDGHKVKPGWGGSGYLGVGFGLNDKLSLGARIVQAYYSEMQADGVTVEGSDLEPLVLTLSASYRAWENWVMTPYITFGLNDDAPSSVLGIRTTRRWQ